RNKDRMTLTDPVGPINCLVLDRRVPPAVEQKDVASKFDIEPHASGAVAHEKNVLAWVAAETRQYLLTLPLRYLTVKLQGAVTLQCLGEKLERLNPLGKDKSLAAAGRDFCQIGSKLIDFHAFLGQRVEITNLLKPHNEFKNMLDGD